jgi:hypothetical protein
MLIPYEQLLIQTFHHKGNLIPEQSQGEHNPLFQLAIDTDLNVIATPTPINTSHRLSQPVLIWSRLKKLAPQIGEYVLTDIAFSLSLALNY